jgi:putative peptidoglycan lipid II flippase
MYLRAGVLSLGLLLLSRVLGLLRESAQAAAFGSTGLGDAVIVMFTLPDLLVSILVSGALSYVLLPVWAQQDPADLQRSQRRVAGGLLVGGIGIGLLVWLMRGTVGHALAPGLQGDMQAVGAASLGWSALVLPMAMMAALWVTRLQHERDFVGMYAGSLIVNVLLVLALVVVWLRGADTDHAGSSVLVLGVFLVLAMLARLAWLYWRLPKGPAPVLRDGTSTALPKASVWVWAALSSGLLLLLPLMARSLASQSGEGALANFNYAWKLVELPLILAIQLVASLAFPAITRTNPDSPERNQALQVAFVLAWALACAAIVVVASFSLPLAKLLFGWGRMSEANLQTIAQWSAAGIWSLLPQALIAVVLTVVAISQQMHVAVWAYSAGAIALAIAGWLGLANGLGGGLAVMWALDLVLAGVALVLMLSQRASIKAGLPFAAMLVPLAVCVMLVFMRPFLPVMGLAGSASLAAVFATLVMAGAVLASPSLRGMAVKLRKPH